MHSFAFPNDANCACKESDGEADDEAYVKPGDEADDGPDDKADDHGSGIIRLLKYSSPKHSKVC